MKTHRWDSPEERLSSSLCVCNGLLWISTKKRKGSIEKHKDGQTTFSKILHSDAYKVGLEILGQNVSFLFCLATGQNGRTAYIRFVDPAQKMGKKPERINPQNLITLLWCPCRLVGRTI